MTKAKAPTKAEVKAAEAAVTVEWLPIMKLWSVQASAVVAAIAGAYASSTALQGMISPTQFASGMAIAQLVVLVLRTLTQGDTAAK